MTRATLILLLLLGSGALLRAEPASVVPTAERIDDRTATLALAEALFDQTATRGEALATLTAWLARDPGDADAVALLARFEVGTGRAREAAARLAALSAQSALTPAAQQTWIEACLQLGRFAAAARLSDELLARTAHPDSGLLLAAGNTRLFAGQAAAAAPFFAQALALEPGNAAARRALALAYAYSGQAAAAQPLLETVARAHPDDEEVVRALVGLTRDPAAADRILELVGRPAAQNPPDPRLLMDWADLENTRGHAAAARALYLQARDLARREPVAGFALRFAHARLAWGDFYGAESAFRAALVLKPDDPSLRHDLLSLLVAMDRREEAQANVQAWLALHPRSRPALEAQLDIQRKRHDDAGAAAALAQLQAVDPGYAPEAAVNHDPLAVRFRTAGLQRMRTAAFLQTLTAGTDAYQARGESLPPGTRAPLSARALQEAAGLYAGQGDFARAVRCLRAARLADPEYFPAQLDLAEYLAIDGQYAEADREFARLAQEYPGSRQVLLKQARALGWGRHYQASLDAYAALRRRQPADPVPLLEQARVAGWAKHRAASAALYAEAWQTPVDQRLAAALRPILAREPAPAPAIVRHWQVWADHAPLPPAAPGPVQPAAPEPFAAMAELTAAAPELAAALSPAGRVAFAQLQSDLAADFWLQRDFWLENRAKQLVWTQQWWRAEQAYDRLLAVDPGNQEALFDLAQVQAAQGLGDRERATLHRLLGIDANNRLAGDALFRRQRRSEPQAFLQFNSYRESGRDDLSSMRRERLTLGGDAVYDDRFRFQAALVRWRDRPDTSARVYDDRGFMLGAQGTFTNWLSASADYTHKAPASARLGTIDTGGLQAWATMPEIWRVGAGVQVQEEVANAFALIQGIRSTHRWFGTEATLTPRFAVTGRFEAIAYSDHNAGHDLWIAPAYTWTDHPRIFKTTLTLESRDTDHANLYQYTGADLTDIIHPYWTPRNYRGAALTFEWRHDLARTFIAGAPEHWYDLRATASLSNDRNRGIGWAADYVREWRDRWVLRLSLEQTYSRQWRDFLAQVRLSRRF